MKKDAVAIVVGPKGRGSNMLALAQAANDPDFPARIAVVISPLGDTAAAENARAMGLRLEVVPPEPLDTYGARLMAVLSDARVEWICLAGYTRLLPAEVLAAFPNRVLNIHPALLPKFGGKGMYGMRVHEAVLGSGDEESGCTVHLVNERYDDGAIVLQRRVPVVAGDTPEILAKRVLQQEHLAYAEALAKVIFEKTMSRDEG